MYHLALEPERILRWQIDNLALPSESIVRLFVQRSIRLLIWGLQRGISQSIEDLPTTISTLWSGTGISPNEPSLTDTFNPCSLLIYWTNPSFFSKACLIPEEGSIAVKILIFSFASGEDMRLAVNIPVPAPLFYGGESLKVGIFRCEINRIENGWENDPNLHFDDVSIVHITR